MILVSMIYRELNMVLAFDSSMHMFVSQVALCAGCNAVHPYAAFVIGIIAGMAYVAWSTVLLRLRVDDPLDAVAGKSQQNMQEF